MVDIMAASEARTLTHRWFRIERLHGDRYDRRSREDVDEVDPPHPAGDRRRAPAAPARTVDRRPARRSRAYPGPHRHLARARPGLPLPLRRSALEGMGGP